MRGALQTAGRTRARPGAQGVVPAGASLTGLDPIVPDWVEGGDSTCEPPYCDRAIMGFTFAPPVIEWGWRIQVEVCIFGFCFDIFYARVGYEFNLAAGLRLPVEIYFEGDEEDGIQDWLDGEDNDGDGRIDEVLAEESFSLQTKIQPTDFTVTDYEAFCREHDLDDPWYIANCRERFSFPDFLDPTDGDEFVAQYSIWAGIIVKVFEIPLINWSVGSSMDVPAACTMFKILSGVEGMSWEDMYYLVTELASADDPQGVLQALK